MKICAGFLMLGGLLLGQTPANYDEAKVPHFVLPELLRTRAGAAVTDAARWEKERRPEVFELLETGMFGKVKPKPADLRFELESMSREALGGKAVRKEVAIRAGGQDLHLLLYLPKGAKGPVPVFLGLNFTGNHTVAQDAGSRLAEVWSFDKAKGALVAKRGAESERGANASRWPVELILSRGYGVATMYYGDIEPDHPDGLALGVRQKLLRAGEQRPDANDWGALAAWGWGLSRMVDYLETDKDVDAKRLAVTGHSRLGKAALWAGARDARFAMVISNDSGEGGAALSRREFGETVAALNRSFPNWFCANYAQYNGREQEMPFDAHMLLALIAPRPLYVASASEDLWADPKGEFLAAVAVTPLYKLFGKSGVEGRELPPVGQAVGGEVHYHVRAGKHDITEFDWRQYLDFADRYLKPGAKTAR